MRKSVILLVLSLLLLGAVGYWYAVEVAQSNEIQKANQAVQLAAEANGALENESYSVGVGQDGTHRFGFDEAIPRYQQIMELYPDEVLPYQNLAIARVLKLAATESQTGEDNAQVDTAKSKKELLQEAAEAVEALLAKEDSAVCQWLQGQLLHVAGVPKNTQPKILEQYLKAAKRDPDEPLFWGAVLEANQAYQLNNAEAEAEAIRNLQRLSSGNVYVVVKALLLAAQKGLPEFTASWKTNRNTLVRVNQIIQQYRGKDALGGNLDSYLTSLDQAIQEGDLPTIQRVMPDMANVISGKDPYKVSISQLSPNPLDFLKRHFSEPIERLASNVDDGFQGDWQPIQMESVEVLPASQQVLDFSLVDVNFDGVLDAVVLTSGSLKVLRGPLDKSAPEVLVQQTVPATATGVTAQYLLQIAEHGSGIDREMREVQSTDQDVVTHNELPQIMVWGEDGLQVWDLTWSESSGFEMKLLQQPDSIQSLRGIRSAIVLDYDQDADLDLAVATDSGFAILMNRADNTFVPGTEWSGADVQQLLVRQMEVVDWDRDLDSDLIVLTDQGQLLLLENQLFGVFTVNPLDAVTSHARSFALADFDGNASWDLLVDGTLFFTRTQPGAKVTFIQESMSVPGSAVSSWQVGDFNNDMVNDIGILAQTGLTGKMRGSWTSEGIKRYEVDGQAAPDNGIAVGDQGDLNSDGLLDLLAVQDSALVAFRNSTKTKNHWLSVVPRGRGDNASKVNHLAIGSLLEARVGNRYFATTVRRPAVHFGLGSSTKVDLARIIWPDGIPQSLLLTQGDQQVDMLYILKGSCPFIYGWGPDGWEFLSDCLWAAPIGLQSPAGGLVPTRNWEYLRIAPDKLVDQDGQYRLMLTEELWETAYFDQVRLQVIDHPVGTEVHINDKVGPPSVTEHRLYLVAEKQPILSAVDPRGNDVLSQIQAEDEVYFKGFQKRMVQGFVEDHWIELKLPEALTADATLFLTGWIQPTDTSINILLRQNPGTEGPAFPTMEVVGEDGQWKPASRPIGFPGGKTKTMAIGLDGLFPTADHRLRIRTSNEIYWDHIYVADAPESANSVLSVSDCLLESARLSFRGTSRRLPEVINGPERFDADDVSAVSVWPPVSGPFTAYGDVLSIVEKADDDMAILGTGDALTLAFRNPGAVAAGMQRTFLFYSVGYDKDADMNTLAGQDSLPLPFAQMQSYPEDRATSVEQSHLQRSAGYRRQSWYRFWHQIRNPMVVHAREETKVPVGQ